MTFSIIQTDICHFLQIMNNVNFLIVYVTSSIRNFNRTALTYRFKAFYLKRIVLFGRFTIKYIVVSNNLLIS